MAHFAELNENNEVIFVTVVHNNELMDNGIESESKGIEFLKHLGENRKWIQTSYNCNFRKRYAAIGDHYDVERDAFISPKPFDSWILNDDTCLWESPIPHPDDTSKAYNWNEDILNWEEIQASE
jgi:hypothetical protein